MALNVLNFLSPRDERLAAAGAITELASKGWLIPTGEIGRLMRANVRDTEKALAYRVALSASERGDNEREVVLGWLRERILNWHHEHSTSALSNLVNEEAYEVTRYLFRRIEAD